MRVDGRDDRDPIRNDESLSRQAGARVPGGRPWLRGLHTLESIPGQGAIRLDDIPVRKRDKENQKDGTESGVQDRL